jgi:predicted CopG family antitoxin
LGRIRYIRDPTTITVDRDVAEALKKLRRHRGEPVGKVVERLLREHLTREGVVGY